jgi:uncharacterized RDD family membrane protein YckC
MNWYYAQAGQQMGPVDENTLRQLAAAGTIRPDTLVWRAGMANWQPYQTAVPPLAPPPPHPIAPTAPQLQYTPAPPYTGAAPAATRFCTECGNSYPADQLVPFGNSLVCAACKPVFMQKMREGVQPAGSFLYGGFWIRFVAVFIDGMLLNIIGFIILGVIAAAAGINFFDPERMRSQEQLLRIFALEGVFLLISLAMTATYETYCIGRWGFTLGKMICGLKVVMTDGSAVSYGRALGRHFAKYVSAFIFYIGFIMAGFDERKRALHDRLCDTLVVKK